MALAAYRHLLRSTRIAFRVLKDDSRLLTAAHDSARRAFENSRLLPPNGTEALGGIAHAEEVARVLRHNVVQGVRQDGESTGRYSELNRLVGGLKVLTVRCRAEDPRGY
ncbi:hypothetical protein FGG08_002013 [Glutinoglossum americanum]|uniref:Mitochondrial zinc maintenance protein 1, mitochondrial n=1 Tax=Glutinoglossum americanum TaxID=1670608 RepID=A0A9P8I5L8_9PEZI|nr:hypothetical protein FGG08_002013 [Glutinoglossum americanum]